MKKHIAPIFFFLLLLSSLMSCRKGFEFSNSPVNLSFSADTIFLDTVFNSIGSSTRLLKVFNPTEENIIIDRVELAKGKSSFYRLNINGQSTKMAEDVQILANDSIYIFVEVTADVGSANALLYTDSILFNMAGSVKDVDLVTLAKEAYFHYPTNLLPLGSIDLPVSVISQNQTWTNDKPHVVYGYLLIDSLATLTIEPGAEIHFHQNSGMVVLNYGQLLIDPSNSGSIDNPVIFQGDRLEPWYEDVSGQWGGILGGVVILGKGKAEINHAIIKNATTGLRVDSTGGSDGQNLILRNSLLLNHSRVSLFGGFGNILAENTVLGNAGLHNFYAIGGNYIFRHCTFANFNFGIRNTPTLGLFNFFEDQNRVRRLRPLEFASFENCLVTGTQKIELLIGEDKQAQMLYVFKNSLLRVDENPQDNSFDIQDQNFFKTCVFTASAGLKNVQNFNYELDSTSAAIDQGDLAIGNIIPLDIQGKSRTSDLGPDIGAYEYVK